MPASDLVLVGSFVGKLYTLTYSVGGEVYKVVNVAFGAPIVPVEYHVDEGFVFSGWGTLPETMPACNMIVNGIKMKKDEAGDLNGDGIVNISDVTTLVNMILQR
jgi:hypothetical protein